MNAKRLFKTLSNHIKRLVESLATGTYWSRGAYEFRIVAVRFWLCPNQKNPLIIKQTCRNLADELAGRVSAQDMVFGFQVQACVDENKTPIED